MSQSTLPTLLAAIALLLAGFFIQTRPVQESGFKHWLVQCMGSAMYFPGFILMDMCIWIWLSRAYGGWSVPEGNTLILLVYGAPLALTFLTTLLVDIRFRDFGTSITAMALGSTAGVMTLGVVLRLIF